MQCRHSVVKLQNSKAQLCGVFSCKVQLDILYIQMWRTSQCSWCNDCKVAAQQDNPAAIDTAKQQRAVHESCTTARQCNFAAVDIEVAYASVKELLEASGRVAAGLFIKFTLRPLIL